MDISQALQTYRELGVAGLFILMYLATIAMFICDLRKQRAAADENVEKMVRALDASAAASARTGDVLQRVHETLEENSRQLGEFVAYLRGRDGLE